MSADVARDATPGRAASPPRARRARSAARRVARRRSAPAQAATGRAGPAAGSVVADEPTADLRPIGVDGAAAPDEELAAVLDDEHVVARQRELEPAGAEGLEAPILRP